MSFGAGAGGGFGAPSSGGFGALSGGGFKSADPSKGSFFAGGGAAFGTGGRKQPTKQPTTGFGGSAWGQDASRGGGGGRQRGSGRGTRSSPYGGQQGRGVGRGSNRSGPTRGGRSGAQGRSGPGLGGSDQAWGSTAGVNPNQAATHDVVESFQRGTVDGSVYRPKRGNKSVGNDSVTSGNWQANTSESGWANNNNSTFKGDSNKWTHDLHLHQDDQSRSWSAVAKRGRDENAGFGQSRGNPANNAVNINGGFGVPKTGGTPGNGGHMGRGRGRGRGAGRGAGRGRDFAGRVGRFSANSDNVPQQDSGGRGTRQGSRGFSAGSEKDQRTVYVKNVEYSATEDELRSFFQPCGDVDTVTIKKGFAYVVFGMKETVDVAVGFTGSTFRGRPIAVQRYRSSGRGPVSEDSQRPPRQSFDKPKGFNGAFESASPSQGSFFSKPESTLADEASNEFDISRSSRTKGLTGRLAGRLDRKAVEDPFSDARIGNVSDVYENTSTADDETNQEDWSENFSQNEGQYESEEHQPTDDSIDERQKEIEEQRSSLQAQIERLEAAAKRKKMATEQRTQQRLDQSSLQHNAGARSSMGGVSSRLSVRIGTSSNNTATFPSQPSRPDRFDKNLGKDVKRQPFGGVVSRLSAKVGSVGKRTSTFASEHVLELEQSDSDAFYDTAAASNPSKQPLAHQPIQRRAVLPQKISSLDKSTLSPAEPIEDDRRLNILKQKEDHERIVQDKAYSSRDVSSARYIVGTCHDMCPEPERYRRKVNNVSASEGHIFWLECDGMHYTSSTMDHALCIKEYRKEAADNAMALASQLRPVKVLLRTMHFICAEVISLWDTETLQVTRAKVEWHKYLEDRCRGIRKDLSIQNVKSKETVIIFEQIIRFHIVASHHLDGLSDFESAQNDEKLSKSLKTLRDMYRDLRGSEGANSHQNEAELRAYDILMNITRPIQAALQGLPQSVTSHPSMKFAIEMYTLFDAKNYARFFKMAMSTTILNACILHRHFKTLRVSALKIIGRGYSIGSNLGKIPISYLQRVLAFDNETQTKQFAVACGLIVTDTVVNVSPRVDGGTAPSFQCEWIHQKLPVDGTNRLGQVVWGGPLPEWPRIKPIDSFNPRPKSPEFVPVLSNTLKPVAMEPAQRQDFTTVKSSGANTINVPKKQTTSSMQLMTPTFTMPSISTSKPRPSLPALGAKEDTAVATRSSISQSFSKPFGWKESDSMLSKPVATAAIVSEANAFAQDSIKAKEAKVLKKKAEEEKRKEMERRRQEEQQRDIERKRQLQLREQELKERRRREEQARLQAAKEKKERFLTTESIIVFDQLVGHMLETVAEDSITEVREAYYDKLVSRFRITSLFSAWHGKLQHRRLIRSYPLNPAFSKQDKDLKKSIHMRKYRSRRSEIPDLSTVFENGADNLLIQHLKRIKLNREDNQSRMSPIPVTEIVSEALRLKAAAMPTSPYSKVDCSEVKFILSLTELHGGSHAGATSKFSHWATQKIFGRSCGLPGAPLSTTVSTTDGGDGNSLSGLGVDITTEIKWLNMEDFHGNRELETCGALVVFVQYPGPGCDTLEYWAGLSPSISHLAGSVGNINTTVPLMVVHDWPDQLQSPKELFNQVVGRVRRADGAPKFTMSTMSLRSEVISVGYVDPIFVSEADELLAATLRWSIDAVDVYGLSGYVALEFVLDNALEEHIFRSDRVNRMCSEMGSIIDTVEYLIGDINRALDVIADVVDGVGCKGGSLAVQHLKLPGCAAISVEESYHFSRAYLRKIHDSCRDDFTILSTMDRIISDAEASDAVVPWVTLFTRLFYSRLSTISRKKLKIATSETFLNRLNKKIHNALVDQGGFFTPRVARVRAQQSYVATPIDTIVFSEEHEELDAVDMNQSLVELADKEIQIEANKSIAFSEQLASWLESGLE